jgi:hypothetical protein
MFVEKGIPQDNHRRCLKNPAKKQGIRNEVKSRTEGWEEI